jgi:uncharacterized protein (DUF433 family)
MRRGVISMPNKQNTDLYCGKSPGELAVYSIRQVAHHLRLNPGTVRSWAMGRKYAGTLGVRNSPSVICAADIDRNLLSFENLVEVHVLSAIRRIHGISMPRVRRAIGYLKTRFSTSKPLLDKRFFTDGKSLFIHEFGEIVDLCAGGQMEMKQLVETYLRRIERDQAGKPKLLYPFATDELSDAFRPVVINPRIQFGKPCMAGTGIPTAIIAERHRAGDSVQLLAKDYERKPEEIEAAIFYERPAA